MPYRETIETVRGCRIRVMRGGAGRPLLFLHGASGAAMWQPFMETLSADYDVIVPEHPGFGGSETPDWLDNVGDLAFFYLDLIEAWGLDGVHLVGSSLGGWIAAEMAVRDDGRLASLTLVDAAGIKVPGLRMADIFMWSPQETPRHLFHDQSIAERMTAVPPSDAAIEAGLKNRLTTAKLAWQPRFHNPDLRKWLHRVKVPTLVVWGTEDEIFPAGYGEAWQTLIPGARLESVPQCGHLPHVEKPDAFVATLKRFAEEAA